MGWEYLKSATALPHIIFVMMQLVHAGAHNKYEPFDVWFEADGPELIELDGILDRFVQPSNLLQY